MIELLELLEYMMLNDNNKEKYFMFEFEVSQLHLNIIRNNDSSICISEVSTIIENDIYGNFLSAYFPRTPKTAFLLVKSKYFF